MSLYLHIFDRELAGSVQWKFDATLLSNVLVTLMYTSNDKLYSGLSLLYETCASDNKLFQLVLGLASNDVISAVSNHPTLDEFLDSRFSLYSHDSQRYSIYFEGAKREQFTSIKLPIVHKSDSTTKALKASFAEIASGKEHITSNHNFSELIDSKRTLIGLRQAIENIGTRAVTFTAFKDFLSPDSVHDQYFIKRLISEKYTNHYLEHLSADIVTGIARFEYYDYLSKQFPRYDLPLLSMIATSFLPNIYNVDSLKLCEVMATLRNDDSHKLLVQRINMFTVAISTYLRWRCEYKSNVALRNDIVFMYKKLCVHSPQPLTLIDNYQVLKNVIYASNEFEKLLNGFALKDSLFKEALKIVEDEMTGVTRKILICTATDLETKVFYEICRTKGQTPKIFPGKDFAYHFIGNISRSEVFLVQSQMGSGGSGGSSLTTLDAIDYIRPDIVISLGICFGANKKKQNIGDILISRQVQCYELQRVEKDKVVPRGDKMPASPLLISRFDAEKVNWTSSKVHTGLLLSGEKLIDDAEFKKELLKQEPEAIGGEMEGAGILAASYRRNVDWIIVKAICDWAQGKSNKDQGLAATNAIKFCWQILESGSL